MGHRTAEMQTVASLPGSTVQAANNRPTAPVKLCSRGLTSHDGEQEARD